MLDILNLFRGSFLGLLSFMMMVWSFGGFGLHRTYVFLCFCNMTIVIDYLIQMLGYFSHGGFIFLNLCFVREVVMAFYFPLLGAIMADIASRLAFLKNEKYVYAQLRKMPVYIAVLSICYCAYKSAILFGTLPYSSLQTTDGIYKYKFWIEQDLIGQLIDIAMVTLSLICASFTWVWMKNKILYLSLIAYGVVLVLRNLTQSIYLEDTMEVVRMFVLFNCLTTQNLLYDLEDLREKYDKFFNDTFLYYDEE